MYSRNFPSQIRPSTSWKVACYPLRTSIPENDLALAVHRADSGGNRFQNQDGIQALTVPSDATPRRAQPSEMPSIPFEKASFVGDSPLQATEIAKTEFQKRVPVQIWNCPKAKLKRNSATRFSSNRTRHPPRKFKCFVLI
jgi:hypothetical protein